MYTELVTFMSIPCFAKKKCFGGYWGFGELLVMLERIIRKTAVTQGIVAASPVPGVQECDITCTIRVEGMLAHNSVIAFLP